MVSGGESEKDELSQARRDQGDLGNELAEAKRGNEANGFDQFARITAQQDYSLFIYLSFPGGSVRKTLDA